jgi:acetyl esterase
MPVDPHLAGLLELIAQTGQPPVHEGTPAEARAGFRQLALGGRPPQSALPVGSVADQTLPGPGGDLDVRVYRPEEAGPVPTVVLFHGGGWVIGDLDTHDAMARSICRDCRAVVVSVDYRLAPERRSRQRSRTRWRRPGGLPSTSAGSAAMTGWRWPGTAQAATSPP